MVFARWCLPWIDRRGRNSESSGKIVVVVMRMRMVVAVLRFLTGCVESLPHNEVGGKSLWIHLPSYILVLMNASLQVGLLGSE